MKKQEELFPESDLKDYANMKPKITRKELENSPVPEETANSNCVDKYRLSRNKCIHGTLIGIGYCKYCTDEIVPGAGGCPTKVEGLHLDEGKLRMDLIPPEVLEALAGVLTYGCNKYEERNWEGGIKYSKIYGSLLRHMMEWWKGIDIDPESSLPHLHHAICNLAFLITYDARKMEGLDDRQT